MALVPNAKTFSVFISNSTNFSLKIFKRYGAISEQKCESLSENLSLGSPEWPKLETFYSRRFGWKISLSEYFFEFLRNFTFPGFSFPCWPVHCPFASPCEGRE